MNVFDETIQVRITRRQQQGQRVAVLELTPVDQSLLPEFNAGAHIDVHIGSDLTRQYSLCNAPGEANAYRIAVLNDPQSRGGSRALFERFHEGDTIWISAPKNHFEIATHSGTALLVAGGIGITPLLAMAYELREQGRPFEIHYCLSTQDQGAFVSELQTEFPEQLTLHCSDVVKFIPDQVFTSSEAASHLYTCGPEGFMDWVIAAAKNAGFDEDRVHFEYFNLEVETDGDAFEVYCTESDVTVQVASNETIASALLAAGVKVDVSCEQGVCGTCISELLEGEADHRDQFLTDEEKTDNDQIALCCSRANGPRLVIEI